MQSLRPVFYDHYPSLFLLLQEAKLNLHSDWKLPHWSLCSSRPTCKPNAPWYGVLTAAKWLFSMLNLSSQEAAKAYVRYPIKKLHASRTIRFPTIQSLFGSERTCHWNFVRANLFLREMELLKDELLHHRGPLIVAGDFNVWSRQRRLHLLRFCRSVGLRQAIMFDAHHIKAYRQHPLDFIFYRDLTLKEATAIDTSTVSDHNPIYARFLL